MVSNDTGHFNICDFGAVSDGKTNCSTAINSAIEACCEKGGGTVYFPSGQYLTGAIQLKSNLTLSFGAGARVLFSQKTDDYPVVASRWEGVECDVYAPMIYGENLENVTITGRGVLDGQGETWWQQFRDNKLDYPRPRFIGFDNCQNILIEGITLINSPSWTINPVCCTNLTVEKVTIINPANSPNTDGINPDSSKNVHIANCHIDVGDDCIAIKSGTERSNKRVPCENITITNCTMAHGHGGVVIGSEMSGGVRNVVISNCVFEGTDRGIRLKSRRGRGGVVEDIRVDNIIMKEVITPFAVNLYYFCGDGGKEPKVSDKNPYPVTLETPLFRRIHFSNITAREVSATAGFIFGLPEQPVSEITFDNITISMAKKATPGYPDMLSGQEPLAKQGFFCCYTRNIMFRNIHISENEGPVFSIHKSQAIDLFKCISDESDPENRVILLSDIGRGSIRGCNIGKEQGQILKITGINNQLDLEENN